MHRVPEQLFIVSFVINTVAAYAPPCCVNMFNAVRESVIINNKYTLFQTYEQYTDA